MQQWEYEVIFLDGNKDTEIIPLLEAKGREGWDLVSVVQEPHQSERRTQLMAFLKRPIED